MEALGIDGKLLLAQTVNFVLFFFIFKKFLYGPFTSFLKNERKNEDEKQRLLKDLQEKEAHLDKREKEIINDARAQALKIIKTAEETAAKKKKELSDKAHEEISEMKLKSKKDLEDEKAKLYDDLKSHVIQSSKTMTESVLKDFVDSKTQQEMLDHIFKELKKSKVYEN
jgi:F-type H+-transporting ATPase subunit b